MSLSYAWKPIYKKLNCAQTPCGTYITGLCHTSKMLTPYCMLLEFYCCVVKSSSLKGQKNIHQTMLLPMAAVVTDNMPSVCARPEHSGLRTSLSYCPHSVSSVILLTLPFKLPSLTISGPLIGSGSGSSFIHAFSSMFVHFPLVPA